MDYSVQTPPIVHPPVSLPAKIKTDCRIQVDGQTIDAAEGELLIDALNRSGKQLPQVCYHPHLGPIQTCDTCMVEIDGKLMRACGEKVVAVCAGNAA
jgi:formate dehydrogenase major subunit